MAATSLPSTEFVFGSIDGLGNSLGKYVAVTQEAPWRLVSERIGGASPIFRTYVTGLEQDYLDGLVARVPAVVDNVVGIGGGVSIDAAKYIAWRLNRPAIFVPTIVSVDAYVSPASGVRVNGVVRYMGNVVPRKIVIDYEAIRAAPKQFNTAGAGDILSSRTALFDWRLAHEKTGESYDQEIASRVERVLDRLIGDSHEIRNVTDRGIRTLVELHLEESRLQVLAGNARPEEGSEHVYFYSLEKLTKRSFVHGWVVGTGIYIITHLQSREEDDVAKVMDDLGLPFRPAYYQLGKEEFVSTMLGMNEYIKESNFMYTILDTSEITREVIEELWRQLS